MLQNNDDMMYKSATKLSFNLFNGYQTKLKHKTSFIRILVFILYRL